MHKILFLLTIMLLSQPVAIRAQESPQVLGYGVKGCDHYNHSYNGWQEGQGDHIAEYIHYRDWLTGLVTGLSLATGTDVLKGVDVKGAMRRIQLYCDEHPTDDFFTASMDLIRLLSNLK
ncbi:hypothetical protein [Sedimenticola selenatireducens]|uniref:hypothetical protein n=1 Tax=Sedimenticola selenatireducens TaxID=191960 RepID=UPI001194E0D9|nr:hypothetical protein [Sedimenticola selenatireducens]TVT65435.1 MAG: hypothetical protein FHK78_04310 [Sedimenticola selenatireducens]